MSPGIQGEVHGVPGGQVRCQGCPWVRGDARGSRGTSRGSMATFDGPSDDLQGTTGFLKGPIG